jgi:hypothetical protein
LAQEIILLKYTSDQNLMVLSGIFVAVYGAAQDAQKPDFLAELVRTCENETLPILVGGYFNIIRRP